MKKRNGIARRDFFKTGALGLAGLSTGLKAAPTRKKQDEGKPELPEIKSFRTLGRTGFKVSDLGIGTSRAFVVPLISAALDAGINYIDTAEGYGRGQSETAIGEALQGHDRKKIFITTKVQARDLNAKEQIIEKVNQSLERLKTDWIDCMMMQGSPTVESLKNEAFHQAMEQLKKEKKVRFIGVANHGSRFQGQGESMEQVLLGAVEDGRFDLLLLIYNFLQKESGEKILEAAARKNLATTIMKSDPLGRYFETRDRIEAMKKTGETPDERMLQSLERMEETAKQGQPFIDKYNLKTPTEIKIAALKFVLDHPGVHTLNLAFNTYDDLVNLLPISGSGLSKGEKTKLLAFEQSFSRLYCRHGCGECESSCPSKVPVNTIMRYFHYFDAHGSERFAMAKYAGLPTAKADLCRTCTGHCEKSCPHGVPIQGMLNIAHSRLTLA